jgi:hypothetical protein
MSFSGNDETEFSKKLQGQKQWLRDSERSGGLVRFEALNDSAF